ncbi:hypothetical protein [Aquitalea pelogenes]|uniref:hypothetical protein n=1 Tax=Aquitalea pelogenes TaxID=1293573 RepID=UPI001956A638|nr:hypothetical protein [Aquitalea pelogenes]
MSNHDDTRLGLAAAVAQVILQGNAFAMAQQAVPFPDTNNPAVLLHAGQLTGSFS